MATAFATFGQKMPKKKAQPLSRPASLVKSLHTQQSEHKTGYAAPVANPVKFYAPPPPPSPPVSLYLPPPPIPSTLYAAPAPAPAPEALASSKATSVVQVVDNDADDDDNEPMEPMDASYTFGYNSEDGSREETSDASGNIRGKYSYVNAEGNTIIVYYSAGPDQGFVIENEEELEGQVAKATLDAARVAVVAAEEDDQEQEETSLDIRQTQVISTYEQPEVGVDGCEDEDVVQVSAEIHFEQPDVDEETW